MLPASAALANSAVTLPGLRAQPTKLELRADHLAAKTAGHCTKGRACATQMSLEGRVYVGGGGLRIEAPRMRLLLDGRGQAVSLEAGGKVRFALHGRRASADKLSFAVQRGLVELIGSANLRLPRMHLDLKGARIRIDLKSGAVSVAKARVRMEVRAP